MRDSIVLYGLGGSDVQFVAIVYEVIPNPQHRSIKSRYKRLLYTADCLIDENPGVEHVYAIHNRPGLAQEYRDSVFDRKNSIESRYVFRDTLETEGILIL